MKKIKSILTSVIALVTMATVFTSCVKDVVEDVMGLEEYFIVLDEVDTNLADANNGNLLNQAIYDDFRFDKGGKSQSLGKGDIAPLGVFDKSIQNIQNTLQAEWIGKIPEGGWIVYKFSLRKGSAKGKIQKESSITIQ